MIKLVSGIISDKIGKRKLPVLAVITLLILFIGFGFTDSLLALRRTFILAIIPGMLAVPTVIFFVRESAPANDNSKLFKFPLKNFDRNFKTYLLIMILFTPGNSSDAFLLFRIEESISKSGAVAFGFGGTLAIDSMILLAVKVKEPEKNLI